ncbi:hypothetical protein GCM10010124_11420 [Pilimelia terevasa]|uniref:Uncharacterized protein n=1 Tax=Pilimelia terevasa TaxID=53372 RepID=A0A8J3FG31_9ACTN|nr:DUF4360 domain-containing protein [Pilimelia terevasa]GGK20535.1 hypothetical protein GCM10010124_11420 [Pilimelia terevasa]
MRHRLTRAVTAVAVITLPATVGAYPASAGTMAQEPSNVAALVHLGSAGTGCKKDSVQATELPDGSLGLTYPDLALKAAGHRTCGSIFELDPPEGWTAAVPGVRLAGTGHLVGSAKATLTTSTYFGGASPDEVAETGTTMSSLRGTYRVRNDFPVERLAFQPCGRKTFLNIDVVIGLETDKVPSTFALRQLVVSPADFVYRQCPR